MSCRAAASCRVRISSLEQAHFSAKALARLFSCLVVPGESWFLAPVTAVRVSTTVCTAGSSWPLAASAPSDSGANR